MLRLHLPKRMGININSGNERWVYHIGMEMTNENNKINGDGVAAFDGYAALFLWRGGECINDRISN